MHTTRIASGQCAWAAHLTARNGRDIAQAEIFLAYSDRRLIQWATSSVKPPLADAPQCAYCSTLPLPSCCFPPAPPALLTTPAKNRAYPVDPLKNAVQDAQALASTLTALGFSVTQLQNAGYREMLDALRNFGQNMQRQRGTALFYFSGHGLQLEGENYLLPIDSDIRRAHEIKYSALHVAQVLDEMEYANNRVNIVVLDASRNSSFAGEYRSVSRDRTLHSTRQYL